MHLSGISTCSCDSGLSGDEFPLLLPQKQLFKNSKKNEYGATPECFVKENDSGCASDVLGFIAKVSILNNCILVVGYMVSHSLTILSESAHMCVDSLIYITAFGIEKSKNKYAGQSVVGELMDVTAGVMFTLLMMVTQGGCAWQAGVRLIMNDNTTNNTTLSLNSQSMTQYLLYLSLN
eukprot:GHVR01092990.1.p1 GENE.GHVR01092990.1~~GHVR01092990.1.p1  ORF type:complete len:178 (+),score=30.14 GHVR01092990.1:240-773(+)